MTMFVALISFAAGGALTWFAKTRIQALAIGAHALAARLKADAAALEAKAAAVKAVL
jgi:hypothetical protein